MSIEKNQGLRNRVAKSVYKTMQEDFPDIHPAKVNSGDCKSFSESLANVLVTDRVSLEGYVPAINRSDKIDNGLASRHIRHYVVEIGGLYFDAETPYGVADINNMPCIQRCNEEDKNNIVFEA